MKTLDELEAALAAATPGEWKLDPWKDHSDATNGGTVYVGDTYDEEGFISFENIVLEVDCDNYIKSVVPDLELIVMMKNSLPALIECAKALEDLMTEAKARNVCLGTATQHLAALAALTKLEK